MKIISHNPDGYVAIVGHAELEKAVDKYYKPPRLEKLPIGAQYDIGAGYDFRNEIQAACKAMTEATARFERAQKTMFEFAVMVSALPEVPK